MPDLHPYLPLLPRAFDIASAARIEVYDCLYVVLAEREGCDLITCDQRLLNALGAKMPFLIDLATLP
jgi:predicted nucleic acid-binding protein